jgi:hypothetical protein
MKEDDIKHETNSMRLLSLTCSFVALFVISDLLLILINHSYRLERYRP